MARTVAALPEGSRITDYVSLGVICKTFPVSQVRSVLLATAIGLSLGLWAGYAGGRVDSVVMRIADVQLTFPAILTALLIDGVAPGEPRRQQLGCR